MTRTLRAMNLEDFDMGTVAERFGDLPSSQNPPSRNGVVAGGPSDLLPGIAGARSTVGEEVEVTSSMVVLLVTGMASSPADWGGLQR